MRASHNRSSKSAPPAEERSYRGDPSRVSKRGGLQRKLAVALLAAAAIPFLAGLLLSGSLADESLKLGLNPKVTASLEELSSLYPELIRSRRALAEARSDALARRLELASPDFGDEEDRRHAREVIDAACEQDRQLRAVSIREGRSALRVECPTRGGGAEESSIELVRRTAGADMLLVFGLDRALVTAHEEAASLAEIYGSLASGRTAVSSAYRRAFLILLGAWTVIAGIGGFLMARRTTRRVEDLAAATRRVSAGDLSARVLTKGDDELAELGLAFNAMVTELATRGERIVYLEKISSWQEIARRLAHEIKNPLTPIQLAMQQLESRWAKTGDGDPQFGRLLAESAEIVREEIETLGRLVGEFSAFARLPDVSPEPTDLVAWTREFVRSNPDLAESAALSFEAKGEPAFALLDRNMMRRVLVNLVQNAIDAAEHADAIPRVHLAVEANDKWTKLRVSDQGPGMPDEVLKRVFDPYFTTKETGTGLGLTICKKIVLQHGGTITVASPPAGGTIFEIRLPRSTDADSSGPRAPVDL